MMVAPPDETPVTTIEFKVDEDVETADWLVFSHLTSWLAVIV